MKRVLKNVVILLKTHFLNQECWMSGFEVHQVSEVEHNTTE